MSLINCPECKKEVSNEIKTCPHCSCKLKKTHPVRTGIIILFAVWCVIGFFEMDRQNLNAKTLGSFSSSKPLEIIEDGVCDDEFGLKYICGVVVNNSDRPRSFVAVEVNLYDSQGVQIGSTIDNTSNLEPHGKWKFKAMVSEDDAASYKITVRGL